MFSATVLEVYEEYCMIVVLTFKHIQWLNINCWCFRDAGITSIRERTYLHANFDSFIFRVYETALSDTANERVCMGSKVGICIWISMTPRNSRKDFLFRDSPLCPLTLGQVSLEISVSNIPKHTRVIMWPGRGSAWEFLRSFGSSYRYPSRIEQWIL